MSRAKITTVMILSGLYGCSSFSSVQALSDAAVDAAEAEAQNDAQFAQLDASIDTAVKTDALIDSAAETQSIDAKADVSSDPCSYRTTCKKKSVVLRAENAMKLSEVRAITRGIGTCSVDWVLLDRTKMIDRASVVIDVCEDETTYLVAGPLSALADPWLKFSTGLNPAFLCPQRGACSLPYGWLSEQVTVVGKVSP
jgi:hypothetical protein